MVLIVFIVLFMFGVVLDLLIDSVCGVLLMLKWVCEVVMKIIIVGCCSVCDRCIIFVLILMISVVWFIVVVSLFSDMVGSMIVLGVCIVIFCVL